MTLVGLARPVASARAAGAAGAAPWGVWGTSISLPRKRARARTFGQNKGVACGSRVGFLHALGKSGERARERVRGSAHRARRVLLACSAHDSGSVNLMAPPTVGMAPIGRRLVGGLADGAPDPCMRTRAVMMIREAVHLTCQERTVAGRCLGCFKRVFLAKC
jgi:hypothetical protein